MRSKRGNMPDTEENPFLKPSSLPHEAVMFSDIEAEHFLPAVRRGIAEAVKNIEAIKNNPDAPMFENTIAALEFSQDDLTRVTNVLRIMSGVCHSNELETAGLTVEEEMSSHENAVMTDQALFRRVKAVYDARDKLSLDREQKTLLCDTYMKFVDAGALLDAVSQADLHGTDKDIAALMAVFQNNVTKSLGEYKKVIDDEKYLAGVPDRAKDVYKAAAEKENLQGKWLITLSPPPHDIFAHCENRALRKELYEAFYTVASKGQYDNRKVLLDLARLRHHRAQLLGYDNYAEAAFAQKNRMVKDPAAAMKFLKETERVYKAVAEENLQQVRALAKKQDGLTAVEAWDMAYYNRQLQEQLFNADM